MQAREIVACAKTGFSSRLICINSKMIGHEATCSNRVNTETLSVIDINSPRQNVVTTRGVVTLTGLRTKAFQCC